MSITHELDCEVCERSHPAGTGPVRFRLFQRPIYWASEVSPTLGCSIEISCDIYVLLHGLAHNMTRYFMSSDTIVTSRRRVEIQGTSEMTPYFTTTKCNKLFITYVRMSHHLQAGHQNMEAGPPDQNRQGTLSQNIDGT